MIGIINYGMGNLTSVKNALDYLGIRSMIVESPDQLEQVDKIILPGVGAFGKAMENLNNSGFSDAIREAVEVKKVPMLGICLGMQLLLENSTEHGDHDGLGLIKGQVLFFGEVVSGLPIPHMGWNDVVYNNQSVLYKDISDNPNFYFVHSYYCKLGDSSHTAGTTNYGIDFHSSLENGHIFGCQFHPEKSQRNGLGIFKNFNSF